MLDAYSNANNIQCQINLSYLKLFIFINGIPHIKPYVNTCEEKILRFITLLDEVILTPSSFRIATTTFETVFIKHHAFSLKHHPVYIKE